MLLLRPHLCISTAGGISYTRPQIRAAAFLILTTLAIILLHEKLIFSTSNSNTFDDGSAMIEPQDGSPTHYTEMCTVCCSRQIEQRRLYSSNYYVICLHKQTKTFYYWTPKIGLLFLLLISTIPIILHIGLNYQERAGTSKNLCTLFASPPPRHFLFPPRKMYLFNFTIFHTFRNKRVWLLYDIMVAPIIHYV